MSYGICVCSDCSREVHQGDNREWHHCEDKTPICGFAKYPDSEADIKGKWCGRDRGPTTESKPDFSEDIERAKASFSPNNEGNYRREKKRNRMKTSKIFGLFAILPLLLLVAGCGTAGMINVDAIATTINRVADRDDKYVAADATLSAAQKANDLRDTAMLRNLLNAAKPATQPAQ